MTTDPNRPLTRADLARIAEALDKVGKALRALGIYDIPVCNGVAVVDHDVRDACRDAADAIAAIRSAPPADPTVAYEVLPRNLVDCGAKVSLDAPPAGETERGLAYLDYYAAVILWARKGTGAANPRDTWAGRDDLHDIARADARELLRIFPPPGGEDVLDLWKRAEAAEKALAERTAERDQLRGELDKVKAARCDAIDTIASIQTTIRNFSTKDGPR